MSDWLSNEYGGIGLAGMQNNAWIIGDMFSSSGWGFNAIAAIVGNMEAESGLNPARWENDDVGNLNAGFGLVQWTPATKLRNWISETYGTTDYTNGDYQLDRILFELENGLQYSPTKGFPETFAEWAASDKPPGYLAAAFMKNYERPLKQGLGVKLKRAKLAEYWYTFLTGMEPKKWVPPELVIILKRRDLK